MAGEKAMSDKSGEIKVTKKMISAGVTALEEHLLEDALTGMARPLAVQAIFEAMCKVASERKAAKHRKQA
jgi:hypothetical protein